tara:strand:- start:634 stop:1257 length:624 start_codon:yes stop_codon:yes gene_type:complete
MYNGKLRNFYSKTPNQKYLKEAVSVLNKGGMIIFPTDTVYALGCLSSKEESLKRLAKIKGVRLEQAPLSFIFKDISSLSKFVTPMNSQIFKLVKRLLPGPYALIMKSIKKLPKPFRKRRTIGVRISNHPIPKALVKSVDSPIICTSIHDPDQILDYTTDPEKLLKIWGSKIDLILSDGYGGNVPSTVIDLTVSPIKIIRKGAGKVPF